MSEDDLKSIDLEDTFFLHGHSSKPYLVKLSSTVLSITPQATSSGDQATSVNNTKVIAVDDIYGCLCMKAKENALQCHLTLYLYAPRKNKSTTGTSSKKESLHRSEKILTYGKFDNYERNLAEITQWHRMISYAIYLRRNLPRM
jgi:hypothetical protein